MITGQNHGILASSQLNSTTRRLPHQVPIGPSIVNPTTDVITNVMTGTVINLIAFGTNFFEIFSTTAINNVIKIAGSTLEEYFTNVTGIPNIRILSPASTKPIKVG